MRALCQLVFLVLAVGTLATRGRDRARRGLMWAIVAVGAITILLTSLSSHAAALSEGRTTAIAADFTHLAAASIWVGGVAAFFFLFVGEPRETLATWIHRFSPLAIVCVMFIVLTGVYASVLHLTKPSDVFAGAYGLMIVLKVLLLVPLLAIGAFNRYVARRRLVDGSEWRSSNLHRALILETLLMAGVLVAAGVLATSAPPGLGLDVPDAPDVVTYERSLDKAHMIFTIGPAPITVGLHNYTVELHAFDGSNPDGSEVFLEFAPPGRGKLDTLHPMKRVSADRWVLDGGFLTERGEWTVHVTVQTDEYAQNPFKVIVQ